ncbi:MAG: glycosyltransferase family 4 protein [Chloroflexi bacterium]|nr:glycosyltransferase family 4 protein [Chloroflexota bacterium]
MTHPEARRTRLCVLTSVHPPFDTRVFHRQAKSMAAAGFDVLLIAPGAPAKPIDGVRFASLPTWGGRAGRPLRWPILFLKALRAKADVYHFHDPELLPWGLLLHWVTRKPVIYDAHEYLPEDIRQKHWIPGPLRRPLSTVAAFVERRIAAGLSAVVTVTPDMAERFSKVQRRTVLVRNFPPAPTEQPPAGERQPTVIYAGFMDAGRGLRILEDTARLVRESHAGAAFLILGPVEWHGMPPEAARRTKAEWEARGIRFLGVVPHAEIPGYLASATVGWLPLDPANENYVRAWPVKLAEYMMAALPIVASRLPIPGKVIDDEGCGFAVEPMSAPAHAAAIISLLDDPARAKAIGAAGRAAATRRYTWESEAQRLQTLYTDLARSW